MGHSTTRILAASIAVLALCWMLQRLYGTLGSSPLVGKLYTSYFRTFNSSAGMSRHTLFKDSEGVFNHGTFTVQPIPVLEDNYAYVSAHSRTSPLSSGRLEQSRRVRTSDMVVCLCVLVVVQLLVDTASKSAALIDPAEPDLAIEAVKRHSDLNVTHVLTTHKRQRDNNTTKD